MPASVSAVRRLYVVVALLAIAGIVDSAYALRLHYASSTTHFCDIAENFDCDIVNRSAYSEALGIPVALIGVLGYAVLAGLSLFRRAQAETPGVLLVASILGLAFALYLTYVEAHLLGTWCILCLFSLGLIAAITILAAFIYTFSRRYPMG